MILKHFFIITILSTSFSVFGQYLRNPSFENYPGQHNIPRYWSPCHYNSSPDTQPGFWEVTKEASEGLTYTNLVTRGNLGPYKNTNEDMSTELMTSLKSNKTYTITVDLAYSDNFGHYIDLEWITYANPVMLELFIGKTQCDKSMKIWSSPSIDHTSWQTYHFTFTTTDDYYFLLLAANGVENKKYFGNILIDNITITEKIEPCIIITGEIANVFTPNNDGKNDTFNIDLSNESNVSEINMTIYNRWGALIYNSSETNIQWDGDDMNDGIYYWNYDYKCPSEDHLNHLRGLVHLTR